MRQQQGGHFKALRFAHWSSAFTHDSAVILLKEMAWVEAGRDFFISHEPGLDRILFVHTLDGSGETTYRGEAHLVGKGESLIFNLKDGYSARSMDDYYSFLWIQLEGELANRLLGYIEHDRGNFLSASNDILPVCDKIYQLASRKEWSLATDVEISSCLYKLLGLLLCTSAHSRITGPALEHIQEHYMDTITVESLAQLCHMSSYHFIRCFKEDFGISPHRYITLFRVNKAKNLLLQTKQPVAAIASAVGFHDSSYFTRIFKQYAGRHPTAFRKYPYV